MKFTFCCLLIAACFFQSAYGQDSAVVRVFVQGGDKYRVQIDGELQPLTNKFKVSKGTHNIEIWSFKHETHVGKLETGNLDSTNYFAKLKTDEDYVSFLQNKDTYKRQLFLYKTAPILLTAASVIAVPVTFYALKEKHEELVQDRFFDQYDQTTQATLENTEKQHQLMTTLLATSLAGTALGLAGVFILGPKAKKLLEPKYKQQNPFTLEYINMSFNPTINAPEMGLNLRF